MVTLLITMTIYYFISRSICNFFHSSGSLSHYRARHPKSEKNSYLRDILFCNLFIFLSFLTFYGSIFFILSIYLYLLIKKEFKLFLYLVPGFILSLIIISSLLLQQINNSQIVLKQVMNWSLVLGQANIKNLLLIPIKFSIGKISFEPKIAYWIISAVWTTFLFSFIFKTMLDLRGPTKNRIFLWLFFTPIIIGFLVSFYTPLLQYFRFIYIIPIMIILIAINTNKNWQRIIILSGFAIFSFIYLLNPAYHREDWKSLVSNLNKSKPVYMIYSSSDPVRYYNNKIEIKDIKKLTDYKLKNSIQIIPYTSEIHGVDYKKILNELGYKIINENSYRELKIERWDIE